MIDYEISANSQHYLSVHYHLLVAAFRDVMVSCAIHAQPVGYGSTNLTGLFPMFIYLRLFYLQLSCSHNVICFPLKILHRYWVQFLVGLIIVPWGIESKTYMAGCKQSMSINFGKEKIIHQGRIDKVWKKFEIRMHRNRSQVTTAAPIRQENV